MMPLGGKLGCSRYPGVLAATPRADVTAATWPAGSVTEGSRVTRLLAPTEKLACAVADWRPLLTVASASTVVATARTASSAGPPCWMGRRLSCYAAAAKVMPRPRAAP
ncbi:MAG: hypothetical protein ACRDNZ_11450, partial [Streptosporangiaceae bacterium]